MESPKQRFLKQPDPTLKKLRESLRGDQMRECCDAAILEYAWNQVPTNDIASAACNQHRLEGARAFAMLLQTLADPIKTFEPPKMTGVLEEIKQ